LTYTPVCHTLYTVSTLHCVKLDISRRKRMSQTLYDAIVLGARVAGSPTAMLLARKGYRVLLVDHAAPATRCPPTRSSFPAAPRPALGPAGARRRDWPARRSGSVELTVWPRRPVSRWRVSPASTARAATCSTRFCSTRRVRRAPKFAWTA
jgi:choline dehydrogenase-like flavoprotein